MKISKKLLNIAFRNKKPATLGEELLPEVEKFKNTVEERGVTTLPTRTIKMKQPIENDVVELSAKPKE